MMPVKIAVAHSDSAVSSLLITLLEDEGYQVLLYNDPSTMLTQFYRSRPDLAIVDLSFGSSYPGWTLASQLRADPRTRHIPIVALSTSADLEADRPRNCEHNCELLPEPFDIDSVLGLIRSLLRSPDHCHCG